LPEEESGTCDRWRITGKNPRSRSRRCDVQQENRVSTQQSPSTAERAYLIWEQMGRPEGQALEHWLKAEAELAAEPADSPPRSDRAARMPRRARRRKA